ncbi:hypothetical protein NDU88_003109 [Pleurodeles waltl]|uniref:Uncharacterized protein n=1 Tax=Pleurodeles waltl TaxID=8319 RepID=A0AAV7Q8W2_PLEWA|nr:hypothetical protein NDU88_003109 [Pleurodeles waltl]
METRPKGQKIPYKIVQHAHLIAKRWVARILSTAGVALAKISACMGVAEEHHLRMSQIDQRAADDAMALGLLLYRFNSNEDFNPDFGSRDEGSCLCVSCWYEREM